MFGKENKILGGNTSKILIISYIALSLIFISITLYNNVKFQYGEYRYSQGVNVGLNEGAKQGYERAVIEVIQKSNECQPFPVFVEQGEEETIRADLINIACLQKSEETQSETSVSE